MNNTIHLLIIDDDSTITTFLKEGIEVYTKDVKDIIVDVCRSFDEVVLRLDTRKEAYDIVVADMFLIDTTALDIIEEFQKRHIKVGVIIMTGYIEKFTEEMLQKHFFILQKPIRVAELVKLVRIINRFKNLREAVYGKE